MYCIGQTNKYVIWFEQPVFWWLFADGKLIVAYGNFIEQLSWAIKLLDFVACLTWALVLCAAVSLWSVGEQ